MMGYTNKKKMKLEEKEKEDNNNHTTSSLSLQQRLDEAQAENHDLKRAVHDLIRDRAELQRIKLHPADTIRDALRTVGLNHSIRDPALVMLFRDAVTEAGFEWHRVTQQQQQQHNSFIEFNNKGR